MNKSEANEIRFIELIPKLDSTMRINVYMSIPFSCFFCFLVNGIQMSYFMLFEAQRKFLGMNQNNN